MDLELSPDHQELRAVAAQALQRMAPPSLARSFLDGDGDASELWESLRELGWYSVGADPDDPFGVCGLCLLAEQVGRRAAPTALVDSAVCSRAAVRAGTGSSGVIAQLQAGELTSALAVLESGGSWTATEFSTSAVQTPDRGWAVTGRKLGVHHPSRVDLIGVVATHAGAPILCLVEPAQPGVTIIPAVGLDAASDPGDVVLNSALVTVLVDDPRVVDEALITAGVATAAEGLGAAAAALDAAIAYARERVQYGRAIGSFQALQHLIAELHVRRETAWSTTLFAAATIDESIDGLDETATVAQAYTAAAARAVVEGALQVLGGIGFTWEHDHHLLHRRVLECEQRFGDALHHERRLSALLARRAAQTT